MKHSIFFETNIKNQEFNLNDEIKNIGFYDLPEQDITEIINLSKKIKQKYIVVIGIGGSSLGAEAVFQFISSRKKLNKEMIFLDTTDPITISNKLKKVDLTSSIFIAISKSGTTIESMAILKLIKSLVKLDLNNLIVITDKNSPLEKFAKQNKLRIFNIPKNVGGRYSVLSVVGLVPLAIAGIDIQALLNGAKNIKDEFFQNQKDSLIAKKAEFYSTSCSYFDQNCLFSYSEALRSFNNWYIQLWAESLGKKQLNSSLNVGLTPIGLIGPTDQHSFLQLIIEGKRDKTITIIKVKDFQNNLKIPDISLENLENLDILNNLDFSELINLQADSTMEALIKMGFPVDLIEIEQIDEVAIGELIFYYELLTALTAKHLGINAYDQPGVELGKKILKQKLVERKVEN
jgi:glucose-6-phosphate isomerase